MNVKKLPAATRGLMQNDTFTGYQLFGHGAKNTGRPENFGAVFVFNDDTLGPGAYLGMHPHANTEIVTVVVEGHETHEDNLGYKQELTAGDVQLISAGSGVYHAGGNVATHGPAARHLQIWLAPDVTNTAPSVQLKRGDPAARNRWQPFISPTGAADTLQIKQQAWLSVGTFEAGPVSYLLHRAGHGVLLYVLAGTVKLAGNTFGPDDTAFISDTTAELTLTVEHEASIVLIESVL